MSNRPPLLVLCCGAWTKTMGGDAPALARPVEVSLSYHGQAAGWMRAKRWTKCPCRLRCWRCQQAFYDRELPARAQAP